MKVKIKSLPKQYKDGGKTGKAQNAPIYTSDKKKVQAYQDSLILSNEKLERNAGIEWEGPWANAYDNLTKYNGQQPTNIGRYPGDGGMFKFRKPVQPYIDASKQMQQLPISQANQLPTEQQYIPQPTAIPPLPHYGPNYIQEPGGYGSQRVVNGRIDIPQYGDGGKVKSAKYTTDRKKIQAYQDSLDLFNKYPDIHTNSSHRLKDGRIRFNEYNPTDIGIDISPIYRNIEFAKKQKIKPTATIETGEPFENTVDNIIGGTPRNFVYKQPVQPYIYGEQMQQLPISQAAPLSTAGQNYAPQSVITPQLPNTGPNNYQQQYLGDSYINGVKDIPRSTMYKQGGQVMNKKVRITAVPQMGQGGYGKALRGTGNNINSPNVPVRNNVLSTQWQYINPSDIYTYQPNAYQTKKTLPRAEEGEEDIRIEKQEQVMGDFDGDGQQELMGVNSGSHASGNDIGVSVPDGSFVFSDTKSLKIKDKDILKVFGEGEKPKTPAQIAKKYDLQKYKAIAENPDSDNLSKKTASMMYTNYQGKLSTLAAVQEGMKEEKQANKMMKQGGYYSPGGVFRFDEEPVTVASDFQYVGAPYTIAAQAPGYVSGQPTGPNLMPTPMTPYTPQTMTNPYTIPDAVQDMSGTGTDKPKLRRPQPKGAGFNADVLGDIALGLKAANLQRYKPWEPPVHAVVPKAMFLDPTRELAANSEQAALVGNIAGQYSNASAGRSAASAYQGQALSNAANILSRYNNANVEIGNKANQVAAGITNEKMAQQRERLKSMNSDTFNSQRLYQSELNQLTDELVKRQYQKEDKRRNYAWINKNNPYVQLDANGMPILNTVEQRAAIERIASGQNPGSGGQKTYGDWYNYFTNTMGVTDPDEAKELALDQIAAQSKVPRTRTTKTDKATGTRTTTSGPAKKFGGYTPYQLNKFIASRIG